MDAPIALLQKKEHHFSRCERVGRVFLGIIETVLSLLICKCHSKAAKNYFSKKKEKLYFCLPVTNAGQKILSTQQSTHSTQQPTSDQTPTLTQESPASDQTAPSSPQVAPTPAITLTPEEKKLIEDFTPQMMEVLGGVKKFRDIPFIEWDGVPTNLRPNAPVMRGMNTEGHYLLFCYLKYLKDLGTYKPRVEYLVRKNNSWEGSSILPNELNLRSPAGIPPGSLAEKFMLDKIKRLMQHEPRSGTSKA